ncbi:hypothetical protein EDD11_000859 [Mortierella claussenii]|nr:hypothetical protein EDD11_000859 [Mortierella claussenii]
MSNPLDSTSQVQVGDTADYRYQNDASTPSSYYKPKPVTFKDSISHPINVSWIIPPWISALLLQDMLVPDNLFLIPFAQREAEAMQQMGVGEDAVARAKKMYPNWRPRGNLGLSSCPGKKVRLDGPVNGRAKIVRDLDLDFDRLQKLGFTRVICCLFDEELELLGSPIQKYVEAANSHGIDVIRIPMVEGSTPYSFEEMDRILDKMDETTRNGQNVLAHCRGGVGRAAVVACCWLLRLRYFKDHREVIEWVRAQRSPKAIETKEQAQFVAGFQLWTMGGESRLSSQMYEADIKRRIDWSESNMAQARDAAALLNSTGHRIDFQSSLPLQQPAFQSPSHSDDLQQQQQVEPLTVSQQYQSQPEQGQQQQEVPLNSVQQRQAPPLPLPLPPQQHRQQELQQGSLDRRELGIKRSPVSTSSILSTATVSSRQENAVSPSSLSGANPKPDANGINSSQR